MDRRNTGLVFVLAAVVGLPGDALAAGLPQLDSSTYVPQLIWLAISFLILYLLMARVALPRISQVLEERQHRIENNLERAEKLKAEADEAKEGYEKSLADARAEAQEVFRLAAERLTAEAAERHGELGERLSNEVAAAESRIDAAKAQAIADIRGAASSTAAAATERLIGEAPDAKSVGDIVDSVIGERR